VPALTVAAGAGFTTTSSLLSWLLYGLVAYDGMQARLLQELVDHDFSDDTEVTPELLEDLPELDKFIKEMQRRHNPSYQPGRTAQRDLILPGGYKVKKGTVIIVALHHIHMNPKIWFVSSYSWTRKCKTNHNRAGITPKSSIQTDGTQKKSRTAGEQTTCRKCPHHKSPNPSNTITNNPQQLRRRPEDVRWLQLRAPRDQNLHVSVGLAVQVAERGRSRSRL
jgi:hypothetical protein